MSVRKSTVDHPAAELARRRLSLLGAELSPDGSGSDRGAVAAAMPARPDGAAGRAGRHARPRLSRAGRLAARVADALPPTLHGRIGVTAHHVTVVALLLAATMTLAAWLVVRSDPRPLPREASLQLPVGASPPGAVAARQTPLPDGAAPALPPAPTAGASVPVAAAGSTAATAGQLVVHVAGRVRRPGVVELPAGSRVIDAVEAAGGPRPGARLGTLNLARLLVDGEQIAVGVPVAAAVPQAPAPLGTPIPPAASGTSAPSALVNLNTATQAQLEELPGVGPVTATSIIEWRTEHGGFSTVDELIEVSGIGEVTLAELRDLVTV